MRKTYSIVAQKHCGKDPYLPGLTTGEEAFLVREPTNAYDPNAIQVWIRGERVGYIPKKDNAVLCQFIDQSGEMMAMDSAAPPAKAVKATFIRSKNSAYPMIEV